MNLEKKLVDEITSIVGIDGANKFIEKPPNSDMGDIALNISFDIAKRNKRLPIDISKEIVANIRLKKDSFISKVEAVGGYVNFFYNYTKIANSILPNIDDIYGSSDLGKGKRVMIEHTSVNPNKALHIGHARNSCLGDSLTRILKFSGYDVQVANYIDDTGSQVADNIVGFKFLGFPLKKVGMKLDQYCGDEVYVKVNRMYEEDSSLLEYRKLVLKYIEEGNNEIASFAKTLVDDILKEQLQTCWRMGVEYDLLNHESHILKYKFWDIAFEKLKRAGYIEYEEEGKNKGCWVLKLSRFPQFRGMENPDKILVRSDGTVVYAGKDIAYGMWKHGLLGQNFKYFKFIKQPSGKILWTTTTENDENEHPKFGDVDISINVIDTRQSYEQDVVAIAQNLISGEQKQYKHYAYEVVALSSDTAKQLGVYNDGKRFIQMSGRKGLYINVDKVLDALVKKAYEETKLRNPSAEDKWLKEISEGLSVSALRYELTKVDPNRIITFDLDKSLKLREGTGVYLQYTHARAYNILKKTGDWKYKPIDKIEINKYEKELLKTIIDFPKVVEESANNLKPSIICNYTNNLAINFNTFYQYCPVIKSSENVKNFRLALVDSTKKVLRNSLYLMGIKALDKI